MCILWAVSSRGAVSLSVPSLLSYPTYPLPDRIGRHSISYTSSAEYLMDGHLWGRLGIGPESARQLPGGAPYTQYTRRSGYTLSARYLVVAVRHKPAHFTTSINMSAIYPISDIPKDMEIPYRIYKTGRRTKRPRHLTERPGGLSYDGVNRAALSTIHIRYPTGQEDIS